MLYCCTSMTELANYGLLMLYAGLLYRLHEKVKHAHPARFALLTVTFMSVYRIIYFLLFLPVIIAACGKRFSWKLVLWTGGHRGSFPSSSISSCARLPAPTNRASSTISCAPTSRRPRGCCTSTRHGQPARVFCAGDGQPVSEVDAAVAVLRRNAFVPAGRDPVREKDDRWLYGMCLHRCCCCRGWWSSCFTKRRTGRITGRSRRFCGLRSRGCFYASRSSSPSRISRAARRLVVLLATGAPEGAFSDENRFDPKPFLRRPAGAVRGHPLRSRRNGPVP